MVDHLSSARQALKRPANAAVTDLEACQQRVHEAKATLVAQNENLKTETNRVFAEGGDASALDAIESEQTSIARALRLLDDAAPALTLAIDETRDRERLATRDGVNREFLALQSARMKRAQKIDKALRRFALDLRAEFFDARQCKDLRQQRKELSRDGDPTLLDEDTVTYQVLSRLEGLTRDLKLVSLTGDRVWGSYAGQLSVETEELTDADVPLAAAG